jgi:hypothetical protein
MSRALAPAVVAVLVLAAHGARAEPYDVELRRLGPPTAAVWAGAFPAQCPDPTAPACVQAANDALTRFGILSSQMALGLTTGLLETATTTGHSGFDVALEVSQMGVSPKPVGTSPAGAWTPWPVVSSKSMYELSTAAVHVRKALPWSLEVGARLLYPSQSSYFAAQVEARWALNEGYRYVPDVAVRAAHTQLFAHPTWNLSSTDLEAILSKAFGVNGVMSLAPYGGLRFSFVHASSDALVFSTTATGTAPPGGYPATAAFPGFNSTFTRATVGLRLKTYAVSLAAEGTYLWGGEKGGSGSYPKYEVPSSWGGAARLGFEF